MVSHENGTVKKLDLHEKLKWRYNFPYERIPNQTVKQLINK